jgi:hypothetical protein
MHNYTYQPTTCVLVCVCVCVCFWVTFPFMVAVLKDTFSVCYVSAVRFIDKVIMWQ